MATVSMQLWYSGMPVEKVKKEWNTLAETLGFTRLAGPLKEDGADYKSHDFMEIGKKPASLAIRRMLKGKIAVDISTDSANAIKLETALKKLYGLKEYTPPVESLLINKDADYAGPLLLYSDNLEDCLKRIRLNVKEDNYIYFTPQLRAIHSSLYPDLKKLQEKAKEYALDSKITKNTLWLDFQWTEYVKKLKE